MGDQNLPSESTINMQNGSFTLYGEHLHLEQPYQEAEAALNKHVNYVPDLNDDGFDSWHVGNEIGVLLYGISSTYIVITFLKFKLAGIYWSLNVKDYIEKYKKNNRYYRMSQYEQAILLKNMTQAIGAPTHTAEDGSFGYITDNYRFSASLDRDSICVAGFEDRKLYGR